MQSEAPHGRGINISERLLEFAARIIKFVFKLSRTSIGRYIGGQLMRAATSAGANYEEACGAESRADFVHKLQIVLKELRESLYWLRLIEKSSLVPNTDSDLRDLTVEAKSLAIIGKSIATAKTNALGAKRVISRE